MCDTEGRLKSTYADSAWDMKPLTSRNVIDTLGRVFQRSEDPVGLSAEAKA